MADVSLRPSDPTSRRLTPQTLQQPSANAYLHNLNDPCHASSTVPSPPANTELSITLNIPKMSLATGPDLSQPGVSIEHPPLYTEDIPGTEA
jgi:hypothetical protein